MANITIIAPEEMLQASSSTHFQIFLLTANNEVISWTRHGWQNSSQPQDGFKTMELFPKHEVIDEFYTAKNQPLPMDGILQVIEVLNYQ